MDTCQFNLKTSELQQYLQQLQNLISHLEENQVKEELKNISDRLNQLTLPLLPHIPDVSLIKNQTIDQASKKKIKLTKFEMLIWCLKKIKRTLLFIKKMPRALVRALMPTIKPKIGVLYQYDPHFVPTPKSYLKKINVENPPSISIVTPSYNQGDFLDSTILSVLNQDYPNLEYIIQDGGSNDESIEIIKKFARHLKHWESKKDNGQSNAINLGFKHSSGDIMAYLNSDDMLLPGTLPYVAKYFQEHPEVDVVYGHRIIINEFDHELGRWILPPHNSKILSWADYIPQETLFWRRHIWEKAGGQIDENFKFAMDWDLLLRFREAGATFVRLPRFLGAFRVHTQQKTSAEINNIGHKEMQRLRKRCFGRYLTFREINKNIRWYHLQNLIFDKLYRMGILKY